jgi:hypothetical protein
MSLCVVSRARRRGIPIAGGHRMSARVFACQGRNILQIDVAEARAREHVIEAAAVRLRRGNSEGNRVGKWSSPGIASPSNLLFRSIP